MSYIPNTQKEREEMLKVIGVDSMKELWEKTQVPVADIDFSELPQGKSELEVMSLFKKLASKNASDLTCFMGAGYYDHFAPAAVADLVGRGEFLTAYTPYQPEVSQGTLQVIYEFQSSICKITGMDVSNASMYEGGTALFEAALMAVRQTKRQKVVIAGGLSPIYLKMFNSYNANLNLELVVVPVDGSSASAAALLDAVGDKDTAAVIIQYPNFFGEFNDWTAFNETLKAKDKKILTICSCYPTALALLKTPGEMGFDIACGEAQGLGLPLAFGGPYLGFLACTKKLMRKLPGRICGRTVDSKGRDGFVLTLQAREQHIRREKANSNICSNQGLCALSATIYLSLLGKEGFRQVAELSSSKAAFTRRLMLKLPGVTAVTGENFFNEFVIETPMNARELTAKLLERGYIAGYPLGCYFDDRKNQLLVAVTEQRTKEEIKGLVAAMEAELC